MKFSEKIVKLRKMKGLTQDEFASAVGVSRQAVYKWESGQSYPEVAKLLEIKLLFDISIDNLLDENYEVIVPEKKKKRRVSAETKRALEEQVRLEEGVEAPVVADAPEKVEEPVAVAVEKEPVVEAPKAEEAPVKVEEAPVKAEAEEKKVGFFGRLFGRR